MKVSNWLTNASIELQAHNSVFVSPVVPGAVSEFCDPALGHAVCRARVHEPVGHQHADDWVAVTVHRLQQHKHEHEDGQPGPEQPSLPLTTTFSVNSILLRSGLWSLYI